MYVYSLTDNEITHFICLFNLYKRLNNYLRNCLAKKLFIALLLISIICHVNIIYMYLLHCILVLLCCVMSVFHVFLLLVWRAAVFICAAKPFHSS